MYLHDVMKGNVVDITKYGNLNICFVRLLGSSIWHTFKYNLLDILSVVVFAVYICTSFYILPKKEPKKIVKIKLLSFKTLLI